MKEIPLTQGQVAIVSDEDYEELAKFKWQAIRWKGIETFYATRGQRVAGGKKRTICMHRQIMGVVDAGRKVQVDHVDHDTLNNTRENLRVVDHRTNQTNRNGKAEGRYSSRYVGVSRDGQKWRAQVTIGGKVHNLGRFTTQEEARAAYQTALQNLQP